MKVTVLIQQIHQTFYFDMTCDVAGATEVVKIWFLRIFFSRAFKCHLNFENRSGSFGDQRGGGGLKEPPSNMVEAQNRDANHLRRQECTVQVWESVFQGLNIGKWSTGIH